MPWRPGFPGEVPTLGFDVLNWMTSFLASPDRAEYEPFVPTREQAQFLLNLYAIDPRTGRRRYRRAVLSRPKGWGKSPFLSAIMLAECLAPVVPDGWDAKGRPVARPWTDLRTVRGQIMAVSEDQTRNAWEPLLEMARLGSLVDEYPGFDPMDTFVVLPGRGRIEAVTASAASREGARPICAILDQTESWTPSNGGVKLAATTRRNLGKTGGISIEAPNAYRPGMESVSEASAEYARRIAAGKARDEGLLYDHREAAAGTKLDDRESLLEGLRYAYGDSHWVDLERIVAEIWDPATEPQDARQFYLGQVTHAADSWLSQVEWAACADATKMLHDDDVVTLGFDGSVKDDSTALVACRVEDGHLELVKCWEKPRLAKEGEWRVDTVDVDKHVRAAFDRFTVIGFYADPALWQSYIDLWTTDLGPTVNTAVRRRRRTTIRVKASATKPFEWWTHRSTAMVAALERFETAVRGKELTHDGGSILTSHVLHARRRESRAGWVIAKSHPKSDNKIDAAMAAVLAFEARCDAVAQGVVGMKKPKVRRNQETAVRRGGAIVQRVR